MVIRDPVDVLTAAITKCDDAGWTRSARWFPGPDALGKAQCAGRNRCKYTMTASILRGENELRAGITPAPADGSRPLIRRPRTG
jgi:hypothetical protein